MTVEVPLTQGQVALIDDDDWPLVADRKWYAVRDTHCFYAVVNSLTINGKRHRIRMHRIIVNAPPGFEVDHIDGNGLNNTRANLRICTQAENMQNQRKQRRRLTSTYKGVSRRGNKWRAVIYPPKGTDKRQVYLGQFCSEIEAARAYDQAASHYFGPFAKLNFEERA